MRHVLCIGLLSIFSASSVCASNLVLCGTIRDNSEADQFFAVGIINAHCGFGEGSFFSGTVREEVGSDFYRILIDGLLFGEGQQVLFASGNYSLVGEGLETAAVHVNLDEQNVEAGLAAGGEFVRVSAVGSSFDNNPTVAQANAPAGAQIPVWFTAINQRVGEFSGYGLAQGFLSYDTRDDANPAPFMYIHAEYTYQIVPIPEPTTFALVAVVLGTMAGRIALTCRLRSASPSRSSSAALSAGRASRDVYINRCSAHAETVVPASSVTRYSARCSSSKP